MNTSLMNKITTEIKGGGGMLKRFSRHVSPFTSNSNVLCMRYMMSAADIDIVQMQLWSMSFPVCLFAVITKPQEEEEEEDAATEEEQFEIGISDL